VGGLDLSQTTDLTSATVVIEKDGILNVFAHFWLPENKIDEASARDNVPYRIYEQKGWLSASGDNFVDYHDCHQWFNDLLDKHKIYPQEIGYDRYSSQYLVQEMKADGHQMDDVYQGTNLTPVIREVEGLIKDRKFNFGNNDLLKIHLLNSALKLDVERNKVQLVKISPKDHIDGTAALLDAMCVRQKWWSEIGFRLQNKERK
jgi:phage terminase large subunit-like protein